MKKISVLLIALITATSVFAATDKFMYDDKGQRDPLWPLVSKSGTMVSYSDELTVSDLLLEGIIVDGNQNVAIINGDIVSKGAIVGDFKILKINQHQVVVSKDDKEFTLTLQKEE